MDGDAGGDSAEQCMREPSTGRWATSSYGQGQQDGARQKGDCYTHREDAELSATQSQDDDDSDDRTDPGRPGEGHQQTEADDESDVGRQHSDGKWPWANNLGNGDWQQHGEKDAGKVRMGQCGIRTNPPARIAPVPAAKHAEGRLQDGNGRNAVAAGQQSPGQPP